MRKIPVGTLCSLTYDSWGVRDIRGLAGEKIPAGTVVMVVGPPTMVNVWTYYRILCDERLFYVNGFCLKQL